MDQECPTLESLSDRLKNLERENRTLKRWGVAGLLALVMFVAMGATQNSQTLTAQKLVITDASGNPRAVLTGTPTGASLAFQTPTDLGAYIKRGWLGIGAFSWGSHGKHGG